MNNKKMLKILWKHISLRRKKQLLLLFIIIILASSAEIVSIGMVIPFLGVLSMPEKVFEYPVLEPVIYALDITSNNQLTLLLTILFMSAAVFAAITRLLLLYTMTKLSFLIGADLNSSIYRKTLYQDYINYLSSNSSDIVNGIIVKTGIVVNGVVLSAVNILSSSFIFIAIMGVLFSVNFNVAAALIVSFGFAYMGVVFYTKHKLQENSLHISKTSDEMVKTLQEGVGGMRDVLVDGHQNFYSEIFNNADLRFRLASAENIFISSSPKYIMEALGIILISITAYYLVQEDDGLNVVIPTLGVIALGAQRLLPIMQQLYSSYSSIQGASETFNDVIRFLSKPLPCYAHKKEFVPISFDYFIDIVDVSFRYSRESSWVLKNVNLKILKGQCIGIVGETGSGKSTLMDIIIGLLEPTSGEMIIDNEKICAKNKRSWQLHISHVPQHIFLSDSSIEENIALGIEKSKIDRQDIKKAVECAQLSTLIEELPQGYKTIIGERGIRLSGGQRQRIGIARALYKKSDVIIFDEATSALDDKTEYAVMDAINRLSSDLTVIIIAHRLSTLKGCDKVVEIKNGNALIKTKNEFFFHK